MTDYQASGVMNDRVRPRVLLWVQSDESLPNYAWVAERAGTYRRVRKLREVDLTEWDVIVTDEPHASIATSEYGGLRKAVWGRVPDRLYIFRIFSSNAGGSGRSYFEFNLDEDGSAATDRALKHSAGVAGHKMMRVTALPEPLQDLVKSKLLPAVEERPNQFGILETADELAPAIIDLRPFLIGPTDVIIAASYRRPGGGAIWLLPNDAQDIPAWFDVAITEWHTNDPRTFPNVTTWQTDRAWDTAEERVAREKLRLIDEEYATVAAEYEKSRAQAQRALTDATARAVTGPKSLLTSQDEPLQNAVYEALVHVGFAVDDMDQMWPDRERREDFRISDPDSPDWLVLADATGVAKGAPGSKITTVSGYVTKYVLDEKPEKAPGIWIIVNRLFHRDPKTRGAIYRDDDLAVLTSQNGLAIDSAALFLLIQRVESGSPHAHAARSWLRERFGQATVDDVEEWLAANL
ncbi:hypothetical protein [Agromyces sp. NPDC058104]|uniref:hypothetical protein n=1 Tax=Agromyces sp. NPDC058104 TaxID=3346342 RepID=UPI0036DF72F0